ncbi:MAG TPA: NAD-dependent epimerase/dehydratase family protein [Verrucomicrobiota bacterium]|nr:epimerase [Verrucomicrobiales bacterium]HRI11681.1 NAD-dependent epimerase/dehydratase family protein [Verrucomicrobiota bacterium]
MPLERITDEEELERVLTEPTPELIEFISGVSSPLVILGAGGKMGATVAVLAHRAAAAAGHPLEVVAASRFSDPIVRTRLDDRGIRTRHVDLLEPASVAQLPDSENIVSLVGLKFGTTENPSLTWALNTLAPVHMVARYPSARMVALSTGNVYPQVPLDSRGATEDLALTPLGEYANAAVARERLFEYAARRHGTRIAIVRLNYAVELRYGVLMDIARNIWRGEPVNVANGGFNCVWQGEASERILRCLGLATHPPEAFNLCCPEILSVRDVATRLAAELGKKVAFTGHEASTALLSNPAKLEARLGGLRTPLDHLIRWTADWVKSGGRTLNRPTHFEVRDGRY